MQCFLEAGVEGLGCHVVRFFLATVHLMVETVAHGNRASGRSNIVKETVADFVEIIGLVRSIGIFYIFIVVEGIFPISAIISIIQNMVLK